MKIHVTCKVLYVKILVVYVLKDNNSVNYPKQVLNIVKLVYIGLYQRFNGTLFYPNMFKL